MRNSPEVIERELVSDVEQDTDPELFLIVAGSVREGEEEILALAGEAAGAGGQSGRALLVLAPRHLRERDHWVAACRETGIAFRARRELPFAVPSPDAMRSVAARRAFRAGLIDLPVSLLLLDVHGELLSWYAACDAAFVGGSLVPIGGHNLFEPAREGVPVAFGPHTEGVADLAEPLLRHGGGARVHGSAELQSWVTRLRADPAARRKAAAGALAAAAEVAGGVARTWEFLESMSWTLVMRRRSGM